MCGWQRTEEGGREVVCMGCSMQLGIRRARTAEEGGEGSNGIKLIGALIRVLYTDMWPARESYKGSIPSFFREKVRAFW
jgi:hypothetical protein